MQLLAMLGTLAFVVVGAIVGARLLLLARRTRQLPELCVGGALFFYAAVGQPAVVASRPLGAAFGHEVRLVAVALGLLAIVLSVVGMFLFTRTVFRAHSKLAGASVWIAGAVAAVSSGVVLRSLPVVPGEYSDAMKIGIGLLSASLGAGMVWTSAEALRYHALMRKRLALGLADPVLVNRFLLWGIGCGVPAVTSFAMIACVRAGMDVAVHPVPLLMTACSGSVVAVCWYLSFVPPAGYVRWLCSRAAGQEA